MGLEGEGSGGRGGGKWGKRGREVGIRYPLSTPSKRHLGSRGGGGGGKHLKTN